MILFALLTLAALSVIFLAVVYALMRRPPIVEFRLPPFAPVVHVTVPEIRVAMPPISVDLTRMIPDTLSIRHQAVEPETPMDRAFDEPIPEEIVQYCDQESDEWARVARLRRARTLRAELGSWKAAFSQLQREDQVDLQ